VWLSRWFKQRQAERRIAQERPRILAVSVFVIDRLVLERQCKRHGWELQFTNSPRDAFNLVSRQHFELILCYRQQPGYPWREVIDRLAGISPRSRILLVSPVSDQYLWRAVIEQGGFDILTSPLRDNDVLPLMNAEAHFASHGAR
jgi:CheY-like chemotaxis protein